MIACLWCECPVSDAAPKVEAGKIKLHIACARTLAIYILRAEVTIAHQSRGCTSAPPSRGEDD